MERLWPRGSAHDTEDNGAMVHGDAGLEGVTMANDTTSPGPERTNAPLTAPWLKFDLDDEVHRLWQEEAGRAGRIARTLVKHPDLRVVLTILKAQGRIREHTANGRLSIHAIRGQIRLHVSHAGAAETIDLAAGQLLALDRNIPHDVEALVDSAFLLIVAWPAESAAE
jgi:quercetin dioxygenase-like cupin family protein